MADTGAGPLGGSRPALWRLGASFLLGTAAALAGLILGIPGRGEFVPTIWLAGFAAPLIAPGWVGFAGHGCWCCGNPASGKVLEKLGMSLEGVSREAFQQVGRLGGHRHEGRPSFGVEVAEQLSLDLTGTMTTWCLSPLRSLTGCMIRR